MLSRAFISRQLLKTSSLIGRGVLPLSKRNGMAILCPLALGLGQGKMKIDRALTQMRRDVSERAERARARARESERAKGIALLRRRERKDGRTDGRKEPSEQI